MVDFSKINTAPEDRKTIVAIVVRAIKFGHSRKVEIDAIDLDMDLTCVHDRNPLKLSKLLKADELNFGHDIFGIMRFLNRKTGDFRACFVPRCSA